MRICGFICKDFICSRMIDDDREQFRNVMDKVDYSDLHILYSYDLEMYGHAFTKPSDIELFYNTYYDYLENNCSFEDYHIFEIDDIGLLHVKGCLDTEECNDYIKFLEEKYFIQQVKAQKETIKSICKECSGKGILDFGFYTRKCMSCCNE